MPSEKTPSQIIQIAKICQVLASDDRANQNLLHGAILDERYPVMLYMERKAVEWVNTYDPTNATLQQMANYLWGLCWKYAAQAQTILNNLTQTISISNPSNQSVNVGGSATFSVTVTSGLPYVVQWFKNGVIIPGANSLSYVVTNAQLTDSGTLFSATATSAAGVASSATATLTVTSVITGFFAYMDNDPYATLVGNTDPFTYQVSYTISHNSQIAITMPSASVPNKYLIVKVPISEPTYNTWADGPFNFGTLGLTGDFDWRGYLQFGGFTYYASRQALSLDTSFQLVFTP